MLKTCSTRDRFCLPGTYSLDIHSVLPDFLMSNLLPNEVSSTSFSDLFSASEREEVLRLTKSFPRDAVLQALLLSQWKGEEAIISLEAPKVHDDADGFKLIPSTTTSESPAAHLTEAQQIAAKADLGYIVLRTEAGFEHHRGIHRKNWKTLWISFGLQPPKRVPKGWLIRHSLTKEENQKLWSAQLLQGSPPLHDP